MGDKKFSDIFKVGDIYYKKDDCRSIYTKVTKIIKDTYISIEIISLKNNVILKYTCDSYTYPLFNTDYLIRQFGAKTTNVPDYIENDIEEYYISENSNNYLTKNGYVNCLISNDKRELDFPIKFKTISIEKRFVFNWDTIEYEAVNDGI